MDFVLESDNKSTLGELMAWDRAVAPFTNMV